MHVCKNSLIVALVVVCTQGFVSSAASPTQEDVARQSLESVNVTQNKNLDNSGAIHAFEGPNPGEASGKSPGVVKSRRRITPIMFINPQSENDTCSDSQDDFPNFFTDEQRKAGAILVSFMVGIYCFTLLAIICDSYFLPCVGRICETLNLSQDVAAATFMAMATSAPELFVNIIGTFLTQSDIGIGTVVGSSMFNTLGVGALGSLAASSPIKVDWWPVTRDCTLYCIAISLLVMMTWDGMIFWYEGMTLFIVYFLYFTVMFNNKRISRVVKGFAAKCSSRPSVSTEELAKPEKSETSNDTIIFFVEEPIKSYCESKDFKAAEEKQEKPMKTEKTNSKLTEASTAVVYYIDEPLEYYSEFNSASEKTKIEEKTTVEEKKVSRAAKLFTMPKGGCFTKAFFIYLWPIKFLLFCMIPNPKTNPKLFPITFVMCILFMGANSYVISWMITIIGYTFGISDSVLGLTFLAAGGCLPEAISIIIMSRRGEGSMGVSNALGANTMNILLSLGLPWFIKTMLIDTPGSAFIEIASGTMEYTILGLMLVAVALFLTLYFNNFQLCKRTGVILTTVYLVFLTMAIISEMMFVETTPCNE